MMKLNAPLPLSFKPRAAPQGRWWLAWLQLLCAWLVCMLLCANVALVLTKGWPQDEGKPAAKTAVGCVPAEPGPRARVAASPKPAHPTQCAGT